MDSSVNSNSAPGGHYATSNHHESEGIKSRRIRIAFVDDSHALTQTMSIAFGLPEYADEYELVATFNSGVAAMNAVGAIDFDLMICDVRMPEMNGYELIRKLKPIDPFRKYLLWSNEGGMPFVREAIDSGADGYLPKAVSLEVLFHSIKRIYDGGTVFDGSGVSPSPLVSSQRYTVVGHPDATVEAAVEMPESIESTPPSLSVADDASESEEWRPMAKLDSTQVLTENEKRIIGMVIKGMTLKEIANITCRASNTISTTKKNAMTKLGVYNIADLIRLSIDRPDLF